ncbi:MFS transporter [Amnibacterium endophyticum]|uniref:MFS transporter n=1 Tax=Amnibacterium endophyticum TaxID=2109337 RepID=A0ABW4LDZ3_9MICO
MGDARDDRITLAAAGGLGALVLASFVAVTTEIVPVGLLPQLTRAFGVSEAVAGLLVTVYAALVAVLAVPLTHLTRALPRKPLLLATVVLYAVGNLVIALAPQFGLVVAGRAIGGVAHALFFSVSSAYAAALVPPRLQGRALAIAASGASLGYVLGVPLVTSIGAALDWRAAFAALVLGAVLVALAGAALLPGVPVAPPPAADARGPRSALTGVAVVNALVFFGHYSLYTYVSALLLTAGLPEGALGAVLFLLGGAGVVGLWLAGLTIDRRPRAGFLGALLLATVCIAALLVLRGTTAGAVSGTTAWLVAFGAVPVFCTAASLRTRSLAPDLSAAVNNAASNVGIGLGAALGGLVFVLGGIGSVVLVAAVAFAVAAALVLLLRGGFPARPPASA